MHFRSWKSVLADLLEKTLKSWFFYRDMGWVELREEFIRFTLLDTPWFTIHLHKLDAPLLHPQCHDHPFHFWTCILYGGYWEYTDSGVAWRGPGSILYRPATFAHNVVTKGVSWSLIVRSRRVRKWGFLTCHE